MKWSTITLSQYQRIEESNALDIPDIDKVLLSVCTIYGLTEHELNNADPKKVMKYIKAVSSLKEFTPVSKNRVGKYVINYDLSKITFGQFVELCFFFNANSSQAIAYVMATMSRRWGRRHRTKNHRKKADYFMNQPVEVVMGSYTRIKWGFEKFISDYKELFGDPKEQGTKETPNEFTRRHGWVYNATRIKDHEGIKLDEVFVMPVRQALAALTFLQAKDKYDAEQIKQSNKNI